MEYRFLLDIALILLSTKLLGLFTRKLNMPQVVGALLAGLILGPAILNILSETEFIKKTAELGVIVLMFSAGLDTNLDELKKAGKASFIIALVGVLVPLAGGYLVAAGFSLTSDIEGGANVFLQNVFIGVILTATSVSISVETLKELGRLNTRAGNAILGAALIDDILGIIALTVISSFADKSVNVWHVLLLIFLFFVFIAVVAVVASKLFTLWFNHHKKDLRRFVVIAFAFCLLLSYLSENLFGVADITGAYFAGLIICNTQRTNYISNRFNTLSYMLLSPIFFASIGIEVALPNMTSTVILFSVVLLVVAILSKVLGCGLGAKMCRYTNSESVQIGVGMISRGEVALIVASKGNALGLMSAVYYGPIVIVIIFTTIVTPILLKLVFRSKRTGRFEGFVQSDLVDEYEENDQIELATQHLLEVNKTIRESQRKNEPEKAAVGTEKPVDKNSQ